jgi:predicted DNA-binding transcriptional regulator YafY
MLQSRKYVNAEHISEKFRISIRTVFRDIKALQEQGIPVGNEPLKGYFVVQGYFLPPVSLSSEEANALLLMENLVHAFADQSIQKHYSNALNKIKSVLKSRQKEKLEDLNENIKLQIPECFKQDQNYLSGLQNAVSAKTAVQIEYKNNSNELSNRVVEPIGLIFYAFSWHLIGWCYLRNEYRDFRVNRIVKLRVTDDPFRKENHIALQDYMQALPVNY